MSNSNEVIFLDILHKSQLLQTVLTRTSFLNLPHWYLGAGCLAQTVWNYYHNYELVKHIKDYDIVYFDSDLSVEKETLIQKRGQGLFADLPIEIDIVNQARVHIWYEKYFGYSIEPYISVEEAISTWPTTATSVGIRLLEDSTYSIQAPYGLEDLLAMTIRANKIQITEEIYTAKVHRWLKVWPMLTVIPWNSNSN